MNKQEFDEATIKCPRCGSRSTQPVSTAYIQSVRIGFHGRETISGFGKTLAPPPAWDDESWPTLIACLSAVGFYFFGADLLAKVGVDFLANHSQFGWQSLLASCLVGWSTGLIAALPALVFNSLKLPDLVSEWANQTVCRRCGNLWRSTRPDHGRLDEIE